MTDVTVATAYTAIKSRLDGESGLIALRYPDDTTPLADTPAAFARIEIQTDAARIAAVGGGTGANLWRTAARVEAQVLVPTDVAEATALGYAEAIAAVFRGAKFSGLQCDQAEVYPGAVTEESGNYRGHLVVASFHFYRNG